MNWSTVLENKIAAYYQNYYKLCGLSDFKERAQKRLKEEEVESERLKYLQQILNEKFSENQKHFICGAGTGGLAVVLAKEYNCEVFGVEPCEEEFEIIQGKCKEAGINPGNFKQEFGENLSFADNQFDVAYCFTVLEHVQDVEKCISEMVRILKPGGFIYINTPNYRFPVERHYKIFFPTFLPKFFGKIYLRLRGKPTKFLNTLNFLTEKKLNKILVRREGICWLRIYRPFGKKKSGFKNLFLNFIKFNLFIYPNQEIVIKKL